ncbi:MAG: tetratricopeptide repeat protein, partial [Rhodothermales bacterium]|nr:tetratricopeptide repeat protein [Rhodothermales bacterium]
IESAFELLKTLVREYPEYAEAQALYAHVTLMNSARMEGHSPWIIAEPQVRRTLQKASALKPDLPEIYLVEGLLHARAHDPKTAIGFFERAIELNPSYAEAYRHLSEAAMALGRTAQAWEALEHARRLDPISVSTLTWVVEQATEYGKTEIADDAMRVLRQVAPISADYLNFHLLSDHFRIAEAAIALEDFRVNWPDEDPHDFHLAYFYAVLGKTDEAMALHPIARAYIASELGQRELALSVMEEEAAKHTDPHDRADLYWQTYTNLGMHDEALEVLSDLWYGYGGEDIGPKMDIGDAYTLVLLLRNAGRADEAAPIAEQVIEINWGTEEAMAPAVRMMEGNYEEALRLMIERTKNGRPPIGFTRIRKIYFMLEDLPEYATLERLTQQWFEEQRALYNELSAANQSRD